MNGGPSGFQNAPVTRAVVLVSSVLTIVFAVRGRSNRLGLSYQDIVNGLPIWRIFASVFAFSSTPELMFGIYLLYYFRVFERQIGSNKYSVFILFSVALSSLFETLALMLIKDFNLSTLASGPYALIFASFVPFYFDIPITSLFRVLGLNFSNKSFIYVAGLQLLLPSWRRSLLPGICGLLVGLLYRLNAFDIRKIKFPKAIESFFSRVFSSSSPSSSHMTSRGSITRNIFPNASRPAQRNYPATARAPAPAPEPPESSIAMLVSMGFDSNSARQALMRARNDINMATNILLESQSLTQ